MGQTLSNHKLGVSGHLLKCDVSHKAPGPKNERMIRNGFFDLESQSYSAPAKRICLIKISVVGFYLRKPTENQVAIYRYLAIEL